MSRQATVYSFRNVALTVNNRPIRGFWEGDDAVSVEPSDDNAVPLVGVDGDATVSYSADDSVMITVKLQPNSPSNDYLNDLYRRAREGRIGAQFPVSLRDTGNGEGGSGSQGHIVKAPTRGFGKNASEREWTIFVNDWNWSEIDYQIEA